MAPRRKEEDLAKALINLEEARDFFYVHRNKLMLPLVKQEPVLDCGCGTGIMTAPLIQEGHDVYSLDPDPRLVKATKRVNPKKTFCMDITKVKKGQLPQFGTVIMGDVLEHIKDDNAAIKAVHSILKKGGEFHISVPHHMALWTVNDELRGHYRRYSKKMLKDRLERHGFRVKKMRLWNALSVPPLLFGRFLGARTPHESIAKGVVNDLLTFYYNAIEANLPLPFGSGLICVAVKR